MDIAAISGVGDREVNEDAFGYVISDNYVCAVVCDGVGGYEAGEIASNMVKDSILNDFDNKPTLDLSLIKKYIEKASKNLLEYKSKTNNESNMFTTLVVAISDGNKMLIGHIGDSRIQVYKDNNVVLKTSDHSLVEKMRQNGEISDKEARHHDERNKLMKALGMKQDISGLLEMNEMELIKDTKYMIVLSSDGFWENISDNKLGRLMRRHKNIDTALMKAERHIKKSRYYSDNYAAIVIKYD